MDWFTALDSPTQVAVIGVVTAIIAAMAGVAVAIVNNRKAGGGKAEIAAMTLDASAVHQVAASIEGLNVTLAEQNKVTQDASDEMTGVLDRFIREVIELRHEVRALADKVRGPR
ncbi:MAG TPA: hypothetical protein VGN60_00690 [Devosia sp.]|nr:hypothetical protein [Devosia sp.]